jgi:hypothetical protein
MSLFPVEIAEKLGLDLLNELKIELYDLAGLSLKVSKVTVSSMQCIDTKKVVPQRTIGLVWNNYIQARHGLLSGEDATALGLLWPNLPRVDSPARLMEDLVAMSRDQKGSWKTLYELLREPGKLSEYRGKTIVLRNGNIVKSLPGPVSAIELGREYGEGNDWAYYYVALE